MQNVDLMTVDAHIATPRVKPVVILQENRQLFVVVEVFLNENQVVALLQQILSDADTPCTAGTLGVHVGKPYLLWQPVYIQRDNAELLLLLCRCGGSNTYRQR